MDEALEISRVPHDGEVVIEWIVPEYTQHERSRNWHIAASVFGFVLLGLAVWFQNFMGAILVLLTAIILLVRHMQLPPQLAVVLYNDGIGVGETFYEYRDFKSFWLLYEEDVKTLYLDFQSSWRPRLPISIEDVDVIAVRKHLLQYLEEDTKKESEPTSDALGRAFKL